MAAVTRRQYKGAAAPTTTTNSLSSVDTSVTLTATTGWPSTVAVPFYVVIDPGTSSEEKCSATISGSTLTLTRGQDDTTAVAHSSGATIYPVFSADDADEANNMAATMTTKGDLLVTTGSAFNRLAVGSDGAVLMADSAQTNGVAWVGNGLSNRNVVINGAMQVAQRGTSTASITAPDTLVVDRFATNFSALGTWTMSQESDAPTGSGFRKSLKMLVTTADASPAATDFAAVKHLLEGQNIQQFLKGTASAKTFSLSMWVKSGTTGTYVSELVDGDNTRFCSQSYTISVVDTWEKKTLVFPADTTGAFDNDNALSLTVNFYLAAGSTRNSGTLQTVWGTSSTANRATGQVNLAAAAVALTNYWQVTGVQLEVGSVATPFEFEDAGTTLAKCQRYYQRTTGTRNFGVTTSQVAADAYGLIPLPCSMRVPPTSVDSNTLRAFDLVNAATTISALTLDGSSSSESYAAIKAVTTGMTAFRTYYIIQNGATSYLGFSAEL